MTRDSHTSYGHVIQDELFQLVMGETPNFDASRALPEFCDLMAKRSVVRSRLADGKWKLVQTVPGSAADNCGMDFILFSLHTSEECPKPVYFFIDVTFNKAVGEEKKSLPLLRFNSLFLVELDYGEELEEGGARLSRKITHASKMDFLDHLCELMGRKQSELNVVDTPPPNYTSKVAHNLIAKEIRNFRNQLDLRVADLQMLVESSRRERSLTWVEENAILRECDLLHSYSIDLARALSFSNYEFVRETDSVHGQKQEMLTERVKIAVGRALRVYLGLEKMWSAKQTLTTHSVYCRRPDEPLCLQVGPQIFKVYDIEKILDGLMTATFEKVAKPNDTFYRAKRALQYPEARIKILELVVSQLQSTSLLALIGESPVVVQTKTAQRKLNKKKR